MITSEILKSIASGLNPRDYAKFAEAVTAIDPVLGATVQMHAKAADANSPDLADWVGHTMDDARALDLDDVTTVEGARAWWLSRYAAA